MIHFNLSREVEREDQLVVFEEGAADVTEEVVGEVVRQVPQSPFQYLRFHAGKDHTS